MKEPRIFPDFLIIGAMKAGTTSLHAYLSKHPEICMSEDKENDYFSRNENYAKGPAWYAGLFDCGKREGLRGETSVTYALRHQYPEAAYRICKDCGQDVKLIYVVRDPADRLRSHYSHNRSAGRIHTGFNAWLSSLKPDSHPILTGKYNHQIEAYLQHFSEKQIFLLSSERLKHDRSLALREVFTFLGVDPEFTHPVFHTLRHRSSRKRVYNAWGRLLARMPVLWRYRDRMPFVGPMVQVEKPTKENLRRLRNFFADDIGKLEALAGREFTEWKTLKNA